MRRIHRRALLCALLFAVIGLNGPYAQEDRQLTTLEYNRGTMRRYERALRAYLRQDFARAEQLVQDTLRREPDALEAKWLLVNIYHKTGRLGLMMEAITEIGIRERTESEYVNQLVRRGSSGYVLSRRADDLVTIDLNESSGAQVGDRYVVYEEGDVLRHPITFVIVDVEQPQRGILEIIEVMDTHSLAQIVDESQTARIERSMRIIDEAEYREITFQGGGSVVEQGAPAGPALVRLNQEYDGFGMSAPEGFAVEPGGSYLIADTGNDRIVRLSAEGDFLGAFGLSGSGPEEMRAPVSIAVQGDQVFVVERANHRVHVINGSDLSHVGVLGSRGTAAPGVFTVPQKVEAVDGDLFVLDPGNRRVQVIQNGEDFLDQAVSSDAIANDPSSFTVTADSVYILDAVGAQVHRFERGAPFASAEVIELPEGLGGRSIVDISAYTAGGRQYFAFVLDRDSEIVITDSGMTNIVTTIGGRGRGEGEFSEPVRVHVDGETMYVLERGNMRVQVIRDAL